jgi:hypothetical protein
MYSFLWDVVWDHIPEEWLPQLQLYKPKNMERKWSLWKKEYAPEII